MDGAAMDGGFEEFCGGVILGDGHGNKHGQATDAAGAGGAHFLVHSDVQTSEVGFFASGDDAHDGSHAGAERGGDKVRGREGFPPALVIDGSIGADDGARGCVAGAAMQIAFVIDFDFNHGV